MDFVVALVLIKASISRSVDEHKGNKSKAIKTASYLGFYVKTLFLIANFLVKKFGIFILNYVCWFDRFSF